MKWPGMDKIRDSADILQPEKEETYQFIEKLLSAVKESFSTNRVHLGMDVHYARNLALPLGELSAQPTERGKHDHTKGQQSTGKRPAVTQ